MSQSALDWPLFPQEGSFTEQQMLRRKQSVLDSYKTMNQRRFEENRVSWDMVLMEAVHEVMVCTDPEQAKVRLDILRVVAETARRSIEQNGGINGKQDDES